MARAIREYQIRPMVCDWALDIPMGNTTFVLHFNSRNNAELVKAILEWEDSHSNEAIPYQPTLTPPNEAEYREYTCPCCSHTWLEDRDALDYPEYCPGCGSTLRDGSTPPNEALSPYPDGDTSIIACPHCGSGEYLHNEDGNEQNYCGQCEQAIDWSRPPEGDEEI